MPNSLGATMTSSAYEFESAARAFCAWAETNEPADSFAEAFEARKLAGTVEMRGATAVSANHREGWD